MRHPPSPTCLRITGEKRILNFESERFLANEPSHNRRKALQVTGTRCKRRRRSRLQHFYDHHGLHFLTAYLHHNPGKRGWVAHPSDGPWSSGRFYDREDASVLDNEGDETA
jgi:hypothetical protein